jgi:hypothetical protein
MVADFIKSQVRGQMGGLALGTRLCYDAQPERKLFVSYCLLLSGLDLDVGTTILLHVKNVKHYGKPKLYLSVIT